MKPSVGVAQLIEAHTGINPVMIDTLSLFTFLLLKNCSSFTIKCGFLWGKTWQVKSFSTTLLQYLVYHIERKMSRKICGGFGLPMRCEGLENRFDGGL